MHFNHIISDSWTAHGPYVYAGTSSGLSCVSIAQAVAGSPTNAWAGALLSMVMTYMSWRMAERTRKQKQADDAVARKLEEDRENDRRKREEDRERALLDLVAQVKDLKFLHMREPEPAPAPAKRSHL